MKGIRPIIFAKFENLMFGPYGLKFHNEVLIMLTVKF